MQYNLNFVTKVNKQHGKGQVTEEEEKVYPIYVPRHSHIIPTYVPYASHIYPTSMVQIRYSKKEHILY